MTLRASLSEVIVLPGGRAAFRPLLLAGSLLAAFALSAAGVSADDGPRLDAPRCTPTAGTTGTVFRFSIVWYGAALPTAHDVHIDSFGSGSIFPMRRVGPGPHGGTLYAYDTRLGAGTHRFRFRFKLEADVLRKPGPSGNNWYSGPSVKAGTERHTVSGLIRVGGAGLSGVAVRLAKAGSPTVTVWSNKEGRYTATGLPPGTYTITAARSGYRLDPRSKTVTVPGSTTTYNFRAVKL